MGEVTYYEHEWERQLASLSLAPSVVEETVTEREREQEQEQKFETEPDTVSVLPGMDSLPPELLCKIFLHCIDDYLPITTTNLSTPLTLSQVCSKWRTVALSFPWLWNKIVLNCGNWKKMNTLIKIARGHLDRSGDLPISIHTLAHMSSIPRPALPDNEEISNLIMPYISRIQHLTLSFPVEWMSNFLHQTANVEDLQSLESLKLMYCPMEGSGHLGQNNFFTFAPKLHKVSIEYLSELGWKYISQNTVHFPWTQLSELNFNHVVASPNYLQTILSSCTTLSKLTLSIIKAADEIPPHFNTIFPNLGLPAPPQLNHLNLPTIRNLTLYNPKNFDYSKYLSSLRIHFPNVEHFSITSSGDTRNGREWSHSQFTSLITESTSTPLLSVSTPSHISDNDIESIMGEVPSLVSLDVIEGNPLSQTTVRLMLQGYLCPNLEILKCQVAPAVLSNFLDMIESRFVGRKSKARYRGFKTLVIRCSKKSAGYLEERERIEELQECGRDITIVDVTQNIM